MAQEKKWHISAQDGIPRVCKAVVRPCPHGSQLTSHYETPQEALDVADKINEMITKGVDFDRDFKVMNVKGKGRAKGKSEKALLYDRAMELAIKEFEEVRQQYSHSIAGQLKHVGIKNFDVNTENGEKIKISQVDDTTANYLDEEAFEQNDDYANYLYPDKTKETLNYKGKKEKQAGSDIVKELSMNTPTGGMVKLDFERDKEGNYIPTEDSVKILEDYAKFAFKIKEMKATREANRKRLMGAMKDADVDNIRIRNMSVKYDPAHYVVKVDKKKVKEDFGADYGKYCKKVYKRTHVRAKAIN